LEPAEETNDIIRRLAVHHADGVIAGIPNCQNRRTVSGARFTAGRVQACVTNGHPLPKTPSEAPTGEPVSVRKAA
jgi:hypothetical protein